MPIPPDPTTVRPHVLKCLRRLLPEDVPFMDDVLNPIEDLGLESMDGLNFVVLLCKELYFDFPDKFNPLYDSAGRTLSIGHIVEGVCRKMGSAPRESLTQTSRP